MEATGAKPVAVSQPTLTLGKRLQLLLGADWKEAYLFMLPALVLLGFVIAYPFANAFYLGFTRTTSLETGPWVGFRNYQLLYKDPFFWDSVRITATYTFAAVALKFVAGIVAATLLHRMKRYATIFTGLVLMPWIMPEVVRAITWKGLLDPIYGMVSPILKDLGLIQQSIPFLGDPKLALPSVIMVNLWAGIPFFTILLLAGMKAIDHELYEAASIDGASGWRKFLHITLPGLKYVIIVETLLSTIWTFNGFTQVFLLTGGGPVGSTKVYTIFAIEAARSFRIGTGVASAMSMVPFLAILIGVLGKYMMAGQTGRGVASADDERGPIASITYLIGWPFRMLLALLIQLFWVVNNALETVVESIGRVLGKALFQSTDARAHIRRAKSNARFVAILAGVVLTLLLLFELIPFYWVFITSFKTDLQNTTFTSIYWPKPWTLAQYEHLLGPDRSFGLWYRNTFLVAMVTPLVSTLVAALGAYGLVRLRWKGSRTLSNLVLVAYLMPGVLLVISIFQIFSKVGLVNNLLGLVVAYSTFALPFALWLMMGYYASVPRELEEAGLIDGCNRFQVFFRIVLPLTKPALMAVFLFGVTAAWNEYLFAFVLITRESLSTLPIGLGRMIIGDVLPWGELTGASFLMAIPVFFIYTIGQRFMVAGLTAGAVKGGA